MADHEDDDITGQLRVLYESAATEVQELCEAFVRESVPPPDEPKKKD